MKSKRIQQIRGFLPTVARQMRREFDTRFADPLKATGDRFVWDYWNVPGQYTLLRTPAHDFFSAKLYDSFHQKLAQWGRQNLGCHDISPVWLSCYVEGCEQRLHADVPHGPWAFVYSLTPWESRVFLGGRTLLLREPILRFTDTLSAHAGLEEGEVFERLEPKFSQLSVFDPRIPRPWVQGALSRADLAQAIDEVMSAPPRKLTSGVLGGSLVVRAWVSASGRVTRAQTVSQSLWSRDPEFALSWERWVLERWRAARLPAKKRPSVLTVPVMFDPA